MPLEKPLEKINLLITNNFYSRFENLKTFEMHNPIIINMFYSQST